MADQTKSQKTRKGPDEAPKGTAPAMPAPSGALSIHGGNMTIEDIGYRETVASLKQLANSWMSHRSRRIGGPPVHRDAWAWCLKWLAEMAARSDALAQVVRGIGLPPLYQTKGEAAAYVYGKALEAMQKPYDDVIGRAAPDAGRYRDHQREFTLEEKILVIAYLDIATIKFDDCATGYGWALVALAKEENVRLPAWPERGPYGY